MKNPQKKILRFAQDDKVVAQEDKEASLRKTKRLRSGWKNVQWTFFGHVLTR